MRSRHRDHYTDTAVTLESEAQGDGASLIAWAEVEIDNLRAAHRWSCETADFGPALQLGSSLQQFWLSARAVSRGPGRLRRRLHRRALPRRWCPPAVWVRAVADAALLAVWFSVPASLQRAEDALDAARELGDQALVVHSLMACSMLVFFDPELAGAVFRRGDRTCALNGRPCPAFTNCAPTSLSPACVAGDPARCPGCRRGGAGPGGCTRRQLHVPVLPHVPQ